MLSPKYAGQYPSRRQALKSLMESWEYDVQRLVKDAIRDTIYAGSLIRGSSLYRPFDFRFGDFGAHDGLRILKFADVRQIRSSWRWEEGLT